MEKQKIRKITMFGVELIDNTLGYSQLVRAQPYTSLNRAHNLKKKMEKRFGAKYRVVQLKWGTLNKKYQEQLILREL